MRTTLAAGWGEGLGKLLCLFDGVVNGGVFPAGITADHVNIALAHGVDDTLCFDFALSGDVDVGGFDHDGMVADKLVVVGDAHPFEVDESLPDEPVDVDLLVGTAADFDVEAEVGTRGDIVVEAHAVEDFVAGEIDPVHLLVAAGKVETQVEYDDFVGVEQRAVAAMGEVDEAVERYGGDEMVVGVGALGGGDGLGVGVDGAYRFAEVYAASVQVVEVAVDQLHGALTGIEEEVVVGGAFLTVVEGHEHVEREFGEEFAHGVALQFVEVAGVELFVIGDEELVGDAGAKFLADEALEGGGVVEAVGEIEVGEALHELVVRQLVDIVLERRVEIAVGIEHLGAFGDIAEFDPVEHLLDEGLGLVGVEVEEVSGDVPDEAGRVEGTAKAAGNGLLFEDEVVVAALFVSEGKAADAGSEDEIFGVLHFELSCRMFDVVCVCFYLCLRCGVMLRQRFCSSCRR